MNIGISLRTKSIEEIDAYIAHFCGSPGESTHFEINYISGFQNIPSREVFLSAVKERVLRNNIKTTVHFPHYNLSEPNVKFQDVIIQEFREMLEYLAEVNNQLIVVHPGYLDYYETPKEADEYFFVRMKKDIEKATEYSVRMLRKLCDLAKSYDMIVLIENLPLPRGIARGYKELLALKKTVARDNLKLILDTGHLHVAGNDMYPNILGMGEDLLHIHAHDNNSLYDQHLIPGAGTIDWTRFKKGLQEIKYDGVIMLELNDSRLESVQKGYNFIKSLFS